MPCDQAENDRLAIHHRIYTFALKGKLTTTPITHQTRRVLDLGTGPGHWAVAMARQYPHLEVVGVDMAVWDVETTEESVGCTGVNWEIDDLDPGWHFSEPFDLIYMRGMKGVFAYWEGVYDEIYKNLAPGGWVEVVDFDMSLPNIEAGVDQFPFPTLAKLYLGVMQAAFKSGRPVGTFYMHPTYLEDAGFTNIKQTYVNVPIGQWPEDEEQRTIGKLHLVCIMEMLETMLLRYLTTWGDATKDHWTREEVMVMVEEAKGEVLDWASGTDRDGNIREGWCASYKWIIGRKP
ncbi:S-adenosyl-L-methionine-dependent methyltransferase [Bimuria novae-zelandiae CBS 107.79]|uniref:S-adenosyl-L-methionine-dependent methyltransferase n=1 Tax=Bimuria novae-zelandiae CBS 107.79 TaxID=1447943 RepID=A0A6A5VF28_9PLEO|nr:S-adenosyl-L-methionine-dependent methyltransferase [Bimuria novae-zelandiae CBS 107.79]